MATQRQSLSTEAAREAGRLGAAQAKVSLPALPTEFYQNTPYAPLVSGQERDVVIALSDRQIDRANQKRAAFTTFYDGLRSDLGRVEE